MKQIIKYFSTLLLLAILFIQGGCNKDPYTYALIETEFGNMKMKLYNSTPIHKENFIKLAKEGFYDGTLFHRVVPGFMAQGGDPSSINSKPGARLGGGGPGYTLKAEIGAPHIRGTVSAARTPDAGNPQRESSGSQFFIVQGSKQLLNTLENIARQKNISYNETQLKLYQEKGGYPSLDADYTVFGEIVEGLEALDKLIIQERDPNNRPLVDIPMKVKIL